MVKRVAATPAAPERRTAILDGAIDVLAARGYAGATMQQIADAAGVDKALLHYYFKDRSGLFTAVAEHVGDRLLQDVARAIDGITDLDELVDVGFGAVWGIVVSDPRLHAVYLNLVSSAVTDAGLQAQTEAIRARYRALMAHCIDTLSAAGWQPAMPADALMTLVLAGVDGLTIEYLARGQTPALDAALVEFRRFLSTVFTRT